MFSKFSLFAFLFFFVLPGIAMAQTTLLTIVGNEDTAKTTWWPEKTYVQTDDWLRHSLVNYGIQTIDPLMDNSVRFSPVVYAAGPLTSSNAKSLGSLYHADIIIQGSMKWSCAPAENTMTCQLQAKLDLASVRETRHKDVTILVDAEAPTEELAKRHAVSVLASKLSAPYWVFVKEANSDRDIPVYTTKPVLLLDALPDADTLVALRKGLKRIDGVTDVTERFVTHGALAIELNPDTPQMSFAELEAVVYQLTSMQQENFVVHETRRSHAGIGIEVITY